MVRMMLINMVEGDEKKVLQQIENVDWERVHEAGIGKLFSFSLL